MNHIFFWRKKPKYDAATGDMLKRAYSPDDVSTCAIIAAPRNRKFVSWISSKLEDMNHMVWKDPYEAQMDDNDWLGQVCRQIEMDDGIIYVISPDTTVNSNCDQCIDFALKHNKRIIPVVFEDVPFENVRPDIAAMKWIFFRPDKDDSEENLEKLDQALNADLKHARYHSTLLISSLRWEGDNYEKSRLLTGTDLTLAKNWLSDCAMGLLPKPTISQVSYITASRNLDEILRRRKLMSSFFFVMTLIVIIWPSWGVFFCLLVFSHIFLYVATSI